MGNKYTLKARPVVSAGRGNVARTCEDALLGLDQLVLVAHLYAQVDHHEHGEVHDDALDEEGVLEVFAKPETMRNSQFFRSG